jgi:hypothetical protein
VLRARHGPISQRNTAGCKGGAKGKKMGRRGERRPVGGYYEAWAGRSRSATTFSVPSVAGSRLCPGSEYLAELSIRRRHSCQPARINKAPFQHGVFCFCDGQHLLVSSIAKYGQLELTVWSRFEIDSHFDFFAAFAVLIWSPGLCAKVSR